MGKLYLRDIAVKRFGLQVDRNMTKQNYEVAYICNGNNPKCAGEPGCYYRKDGRHGPCYHTTDKKFAKHSDLDPKKDRDKFSMYKYGNQKRYYENYPTID